MEFHRDELLYFSLSNHLDLGYASVPPMISWIAWISKSIFGFSPFAVKIFPALLSGVFVYLTAMIAKEFKGGFYAQILTAVAVMCTPLSLRAFILFQPVPLDLFFWTLTLFIVLKYVNTEKTEWLYYLGLTLGLALLNKYLILILIFVLLLVIPFTRHRNLFLSKHFYASVAIALLIWSPNLYWQISNDFPVITHMAQLEETQLRNVSKWSFVKGQLLMLYTSFVIAAIGLMALLKQQKYRMLGALIIGVVILLMLLNAKDYYAAGVYPFLIAAGSVTVASNLTVFWKRLFLIILFIVLVLPILPLGIPFMKPQKIANYLDQLEEIGIDIGRNHEDGQKYPLPQDYADMLGWYEIAQYARQAYDSVDSQETTIIYGENYGLAGAVSLINKEYGHPEALSFFDAFGYWVPESFDPEIKSLIYINDELGSDVAQLFKEIEMIGEVTDPLSRQYGIKVYLCQNPRRSFNEFWTETLLRVRND
ncbi:glycosyltransferase family 39 protein [Portibacter marinus]|uniref:glycosyltransferase family 39 protein n=1 Tax=Portibacter marinus TaxID=2898660 RepID=UPI001F397499|nr:glycosyltransferase family 39 protein [Portibacter marinus]